MYIPTRKTAHVTTVTTHRSCRSQSYSDDGLLRSPNTIASYRITSSADTPSRDPKDWTFEGCDGSCKVGVDAGWVVLDTRSAEAFGSRYLTKTYAVAAPSSFAQYRLRIAANSGDEKTQVGELELF